MKLASKMLFAGLFAVSMLSLAGCGRWSDCFCNPCGTKMNNCQPGAPKCNQPACTDQSAPKCPPKCMPRCQ